MICQAEEFRSIATELIMGRYYDIFGHIYVVERLTN